MQFPSGTGGQGRPSNTGGTGEFGGAGGEGSGGKEPTEEPDPCDAVTCEPRMRCVLEQGEPTCVCHEGFSGPRCEDQNECSAESAPCGEGFACVNYPGSFACVCDAGFSFAQDLCVDADECTRGVVSPCAEEAICENEPGGFSCACPPETFGDGFFCKPEPACSVDSCLPGGTCIETSSGHACVCPSGRAGHDSCETECETLSLPAALEQWVRFLIGKPEGVLLPADVAGISTLIARDLGLSDLSGLECWPGLMHLDLSGNALSAADLSVLSKLNRLSTLRLDCNPIENLDALGAHPSLRSLSLSQTGPTCEASLDDLSALAQLPALSELSLDGQGLTNLSALVGLRALTLLSLNDNALSAADLQALGELPTLSDLRLRDNDLTSLSFLTNVPWIRRLDLSGNDLENLNGVPALTSLEVLAAARNHLTSLTQVGALAQLRELDVSENEIQDLAPLSGVSALFFLNARSNQILSVQPLLTLPHLQTLILDENPLVCGTPADADEKKHLLTLEQHGTWVLGTCASQP